MNVVMKICQSGVNDSGTAGCLNVSWGCESAPSWGCELAAFAVAVAAPAVACTVSAAFAVDTGQSFASCLIYSCCIHPHHAESGHGRSLVLCPGSNKASGSLCGNLGTPYDSDTPVDVSVPGYGMENGIWTESEI